MCIYIYIYIYIYYIYIFRFLNRYYKQKKAPFKVLYKVFKLT